MDRYREIYEILEQDEEDNPINFVDIMKDLGKIDIKGDDLVTSSRYAIFIYLAEKINQLESRIEELES